MIWYSMDLWEREVQRWPRFNLDENLLERKSQRNIGKSRKIGFGRSERGCGRMKNRTTRLRFEEEELANKPVAHAAKKAERAADKADAAKARLPTKNKLKHEKDKAADRKEQLRFGKRIIPKMRMFLKRHLVRQVRKQYQIERNRRAKRAASRNWHSRCK